MEQPDSKELLNQITQLIDSHEQSIQDSGNLVEALKLNLKNKLDSPEFQCGYDEEVFRKFDTKPPIIVWHADKKPESKPEDQIFIGLANQIKSVIDSPDKTITASGPASELVKQLVDQFLSTTENPTHATDNEIFNFVKSHESEIRDFIDKDCQNKMISCLNEKIEEDKMKYNLIFASTVSSGPLLKVADQVEAIREESLPVTENLPAGQSTDVTSKPLQIIYTTSTKEKIKERNSNDDGLELQKSLQILNTEVESKYTDLVIDQINGLKEISHIISPDIKKTEMFTEVQKKYEDEQKVLNELKMKLMEDDETYTSNISKIDIKSPTRTDRRKSSVYSRLLETLNKNSIISSAKNSQSELIRALDAALLGLEKDIQARIFEGAYSTSRSIGQSPFENITMNSHK